MSEKKTELMVQARVKITCFVITRYLCRQLLAYSRAGILSKRAELCKAHTLQAIEVRTPIPKSYIQF